MPSLVRPRPIANCVVTPPGWLPNPSPASVPGDSEPSDVRCCSLRTLLTDSTVPQFAHAGCAAAGSAATMHAAVASNAHRARDGTLIRAAC